MNEIENTICEACYESRHTPGGAGHSLDRHHALNTQLRAERDRLKSLLENWQAAWGLWSDDEDKAQRDCNAAFKEVNEYLELLAEKAHTTIKKDG